MTALARRQIAPDKKRRAFRCWGCSQPMVSDWASVICAACRSTPPAWMQASAAEAVELGGVS